MNAREDKNAVASCTRPIPAAYPRDLFGDDATLRPFERMARSVFGLLPSHLSHRRTPLRCASKYEVAVF